MGQCYSVEIKVRFTDEEGAKKALQAKLDRHEEEHVCYNLDHFKELGIGTDNLGLNPKDGKYCISGDLGYMSLRLFYCGAEVRQYDNGKVFVYFDYDDRVGAWGGYTRKYEVKDLDVFKSPRWKSIIKSEGVKASPDVIMI